MEAGAGLEREIAHAIVIFLFSSARFALFILLFLQHSAERNAKLAN